MHNISVGQGLRYDCRGLFDGSRVGGGAQGGGGVGGDERLQGAGHGAWGGHRYYT